MDGGQLGRGGQFAPAGGEAGRERLGAAVVLVGGLALQNGEAIKTKFLVFNIEVFQIKFF